MGMYATKSTEDESLCLRIKLLKEDGYFCGYRNGSVTWTWGFDCKSSISFIVNIGDYYDGDSPYIRLLYTINPDQEDAKKMDYKIPLVKVPCNLGGFRWAFRCPLYSNGQYCGKKVYKLYKANSAYFGCRHCMGIVYESQRECRSRYEYLGKILKTEKKEGRLYSSIKKWQYKGKPTKRVKRLMQLRNKIPPLSEFDKIFKSIFS